MGYQLYITRAEYWAENDGRRIEKAEWRRVIEQDAELTISEVNGPLFAVWAAVDSHYPSWLDWFEGNIHTKNPDRGTLAKMLQIADRLEATVQGEEGEIYSSLDDYPDSTDIAHHANDRNAYGVARLLKREILLNRLEYIIVGLGVLAYILYDLARG